MPTPRQSLAVCLFTVAFGTNVATPLFLIYEVNLGLSTVVVTALFAIYPIGLAPALVFAGPLSDAYGRRAVLAPGLVLSGIAAAIMLFARTSVPALFAGRFLLGAVSGLVFVTASAWMQELPRGARDQSSQGGPFTAQGESTAMWNARLLSLVLYGGFGLGPFVGGLWAQWGPWPLVVPYLIQLVLVAVSIALFPRIPETVRVAKPRPPVTPNLGVPAGSRRQFWRVLIPTALGVFAFPSLTFGLFPVLLRPRMASVAVFMTGATFLMAMWFIVPAQSWVGRVGPLRSAPVGLLLGAAGTGLGCIAFASGWWPILFPAALCMGTCSGISMTSGLRQVEDLTSARHRGALTGSFYAGAYVGMMAPLIVSTLAKMVGFTAVLAAMTAIAFGLAVWLRVVTQPMLSPAPSPSSTSRSPR